MTTADDKETKAPPPADGRESRRSLVKATAAAPFVLTLGTGAARAATSITCDAKEASQHPGDAADWPPSLTNLDGYTVVTNQTVLGSDYVELQEVPSGQETPASGTAWYRVSDGGYTLAVENNQLLTPSCDNSFVGMR